MTSLFSPFKAVWRASPFSGPDKPLVTVLELNGMIGPSGPGSRRVLNYARMEKAIEAAFKPDNLTAVALSINSPGGSPVQSRLIYSAIRRHAEEKEVPVLAFIEDVGASGGYILALAADEIYADESSIVGSIGVISGGFGFPEAMDRLGVERRVYTAGTNKSQLDPFSPEKPEDVAHLNTILDDTHEKFVALVKSRRGPRVDTDHEDTFTGSFWTATAAKERGLIDGTAHLTEFMKERYGKDVKVKKCAPPSPSLLSRVMGGDALRGHQSHPSAGITLLDPEVLLSVVEERSLKSRFGL